MNNEFPIFSLLVSNFAIFFRRGKNRKKNNIFLRTQTRCLEENEEKHERERKTRKKKETNREAPMASLRITQKS